MTTPFTTSFPYLLIARTFNVDYGIVVCLAETMERLKLDESSLIARESSLAWRVAQALKREKARRLAVSQEAA